MIWWELLERLLPAMSLEGNDACQYTRISVTVFKEELDLRISTPIVHNIHVINYEVLVGFLILKNLLFFCQMDQNRGWVNTPQLSIKHNGNNRFGGHLLIRRGRFFHAQSNSQIIKRYYYSSQVSRENLQNYLRVCIQTEKSATLHFIKIILRNYYWVWDHREQTHCYMWNTAAATF